MNNEGTITVAAGNVAVSLGGGSVFTDASTATGAVTGNIAFGTTAAAQFNTFNNFNSAFGITGDVNSLARSISPTAAISRAT